MSDTKHDLNAHGTGEPRSAPIDSEIDVRRSVEIALWLLGTTIGTLVVGYFIYVGLGKWSTRQNPAARPVSEANQHLLPPAPNLQLHPELELAAMREAERERLTTWGWTDKSLGLAHMPIEEAIDRLAVPEASPAPVTPAAAPAATPPPPASEPAAPQGHEGAAHG